MQKFYRNYAKGLILFIGLLCLIVIGMSIYGGHYLARSGDDFQLIRLADSGPVTFFDTFLSKLNGRFTYALITFLLYQAPGFFILLTPAFFYTLMIGGFYVLAKQIFKVSVTRSYPIAIMGVIFAFSLGMLSPESYKISYYQTVYWLPSYLAYGLPLSLILFMLAYLVKRHRVAPSPKVLVLLFSISLVIGGLHELVAVLGSILLFSLLLLFVLNDSLVNRSKINAQYLLRYIQYFSAVISGFLISIIVNYLLPATAFRRHLSIHERQGKREVLTRSWDFSTNLFHSTLNDPLIYVCFFGVLLCAIVLIRYYLPKRQVPVIHPVITYLSLALSCLVPFMVIFLTALMSRYGQAQDPPERVYLPFYFCLLLCMSFVAFVIAVQTISLSKKAVSATVAAVAVTLIFVSLPTIALYGRQVLSFNNELHSEGIVSRARDQYIREQIRKGEKTIHIHFYMTLGDTPYPKNDKNYWFNYELARYYKIDYLIAD